MPSQPEEHVDDFYEDDIEDDDDLYLDEDCGMGPDGFCSMAGSEFCDWDCPMERNLRRAARKTIGPRTP